MATLIAIDSHSLNFGLQKIARIQNNEKQGRVRIDYCSLAELLAESESLNKVSLRFYTDDSPSNNEGRPMGKIFKFFPNKGYGFVMGTDGNSYFFHHNEIVNKRTLCNKGENRYPHPSSQEFKNYILNKVVTFNAVSMEDSKFRAEDVCLELSEKSLDRFYQLRREPFLQMLEESGYKLVRCRPSKSGGKSKSVDCRIILDALCELDEKDKFILLSDDPIFIDLIKVLTATGTKVVIATFKVSRSDEIREVVEKAGGEVVLLDDHLDSIKLEYDDLDEEIPAAEKSEEVLSTKDAKLEELSEKDVEFWS